MRQTVRLQCTYALNSSVLKISHRPHNFNNRVADFSQVNFDICLNMSAVKWYIFQYHHFEYPISYSGKIDFLNRGCF